MSEFWSLTNENNWVLTSHENFNGSEDIPDFILRLGYHHDPKIFIGDELNFCAIFKHPKKRGFLFQVEIEDFTEILFAESTPAMLKLLEQFNSIISGYFKTQKLIESIKG